MITEHFGWQDLVVYAEYDYWPCHVGRCHYIDFLKMVRSCREYLP